MEKESIYDVCRNDRVNGLKGHVCVDKDGTKSANMSYNGKYGQGYDGCGTHTHDD